MVVVGDLAEEALSQDSSSPPSSPEVTRPTPKQVAKNWSLNDVDLHYTDNDFQNLTTFKLFQQTYSPQIKAENPKVPMSKLMMLLAAKWWDFESLGKKVSDDVKEDPEEEEAVNEEATSAKRTSEKIVQCYEPLMLSSKQVPEIDLFSSDDDEEEEKDTEEKGTSDLEKDPLSSKQVPEIDLFSSDDDEEEEKDTEEKGTSDLEKDPLEDSDDKPPNKKRKLRT